MGWKLIERYELERGKTTTAYKLLHKTVVSALCKRKYTIPIGDLIVFLATKLHQYFV